MPAASQAKAKTAPVDALFASNLNDAQARAARLFTRTNELMIDMARSLWESQAELLQFEAEQTARAMTPPAMSGGPGETLAAYGQQWHDGSERLLSHMRRVNDLVRDYSWQVMDIYAEGLSEATKPVQDALRHGA